MEIPFIMAGDNQESISFPGGIFQVIVFALVLSLIVNALIPEFADAGFMLRNYIMKSAYRVINTTTDIPDGGVRSPLCSISAQGSATITNGVVTAVTLSHSGRGYTSIPVITLSPNAHDPGNVVQPVFDVTMDGNGALSIGIHAGSAGSNLKVGSSGVSGTRTLTIPIPPTVDLCRQN